MGSRLLGTDFFNLPRPRVIAHRGASANYPENTMLAFGTARDLGVGYIELDLHMTSDQVVVVNHDEDLRRASGEEGVIRNLTWNEVEAVDAGYTFSPDGKRFPFRGQGVGIPRLADVLAAFQELCFIIEVKQTSPSLVEPMLEIIESSGMRRRVFIASEHQTVLDEVRALVPGVPTGLSSREVGDFFRAMAPAAAPYNPAGTALQIPVEYESWRLVTSESVAAAHRIGLEMHVWTVNAEAEMRAMLGFGVDGILTDFPARLLNLL
jgi:glycerophosphoryl diester phosphodiesterase